MHWRDIRIRIRVISLKLVMRNDMKLYDSFVYSYRLISRHYTLHTEVLPYGSCSVEHKVMDNFEGLTF
ncbi:hypothetical protein Hanom_Chr07g00593371 [Helianthus anomalus]